MASHFWTVTVAWNDSYAADLTERLTSLREREYMHGLTGNASLDFSLHYRVGNANARYLVVGYLRFETAVAEDVASLAMFNILDKRVKRYGIRLVYAWNEDVAYSHLSDFTDVADTRTKFLNSVVWFHHYKDPAQMSVDADERTALVSDICKHGPFCPSVQRIWSHRGAEALHDGLLPVDHVGVVTDHVSFDGLYAACLLHDYDAVTNYVDTAVSFQNPWSPWHMAAPIFKPLLERANLDAGNSLLPFVVRFRTMPLAVTKFAGTCLEKSWLRNNTPRTWFDRARRDPSVRFVVQVADFLDKFVLGDTKRPGQCKTSAQMSRLLTHGHYKPLRSCLEMCRGESLDLRPVFPQISPRRDLSMRARMWFRSCYLLLSNLPLVEALFVSSPSASRFFCVNVFLAHYPRNVQDCPDLEWGDYTLAISTSAPTTCALIIEIGNICASGTFQNLVGDNLLHSDSTLATCSVAPDRAALLGWLANLWTLVSGFAAKFAGVSQTALEKYRSIVQANLDAYDECFTESVPADSPAYMYHVGIICTQYQLALEAMIYDAHAMYTVKDAD